MNPYKIEPPFVIQFSGGKTSAYMLRKILDAYDGTLPPDGIVCFENTGKEREETLDFVHEIETRWNVPIVWLEYCLKAKEKKDGLTIMGHSFQIVSYETANRDGKPFENVIDKKQFLPNSLRRFCTSELKVKTKDRYVYSIGMKDHVSIVGVRFDEPRRWSRMRSGREEFDNVELPLVDAQVSKEDVFDFWSKQEFRLQLMEHEGNCDLCFIKGIGKITDIIDRKPGLTDWWIRMENKPLGTKSVKWFFRNDRPKYESLKKTTLEQGKLFVDDPSISCFCGD